MRFKNFIITSVLLILLPTYSYIFWVVNFGTARTLALPLNANIIDLGGGDSHFVDALLDRVTN